MGSWFTFHKMWKDVWCKILPVRCVGQHSRCMDCAKYHMMRKKADCKRDRDRIVKAYSNHLRQIFQDRTCWARMEATAEATIKGITATADGSDHLLLAVDGMDGAKFKVPRCAPAAKLSDLWRPTLHFTGALIGGMLEYYAISEPDQKKDCNSTLTIIGRCVDLAESILRRQGRSLPAHMTLWLDNSARENRNAYVQMWAAAAVATNRFRSITCCYFWVGHTHNQMDQRFSGLAAKLKGAVSLQPPTEFLDYISQNYMPARDYGLKVEACISQGGTGVGSDSGGNGVSLSTVSNTEMPSKRFNVQSVGGWQSPNSFACLSGPDPQWSPQLSMVCQ